MTNIAPKINQRFTRYLSIAQPYHRVSISRENEVLIYGTKEEIALGLQLYL